MVVQKVHLIHVQEVPVGLCQHSRLELLLPRLQDMLDIERSRDTVLGGAQRKLHDAHRLLCGIQPSVLRELFCAVGAEHVRVVRIAVERTSGNRRPRGQDLRQRTDGGGFGGALLSFDQRPADAGIDDIQEKGPFHVVLADDRDEWEQKLIHDIHDWTVYPAGGI